MIETHKQYDYLVFIGRFQPFHRAHQSVVAQAFAQAKHVILLLGSANSARSLNNPWTVVEREAMIRSVYDAEHNDRLSIRGIVDYPYDDATWRQQVISTVHDITGAQADVGLIGHMKDSSSYYLELFPDWGLVSVDNIDHISATDVRQFYFSLPKPAQMSYADLDENIILALRAFRQSTEYQRLSAEYHYLLKWQKKWACAPYPPVFVTVDACVLCAGSVLMVQRKGPLGAGLWALPGGFLEQKETLAAGALRELHEETGLLCQERDIIDVTVFANPGRSARGRTITHVHRIELEHTTKDLPALQAGDDAAKARWIAIEALQPNSCFEDHYSIIQQLT